MNFEKIVKVLWLSAAAAALSQSLFAQNGAHAVMQNSGPNTMRSYAWAATTSDPHAVTRGLGQPCGQAENVCYYLPADLMSAYAISSIAHSSGGAGITVAIVDAYYNSQTAADLATFSSAFSLPACTTASGCLTIVNQSGVNCTTTPASCVSGSTFNIEGWALETDLDVQAIHGLAPNAKILLITAASTSDSDLFAAVKYGATHADVVTSSWGGGEFSGEASLESNFSNSTIPLLWSAGDSGGASPEYPCMSAYAVCVGGTHLLATAAGFRASESAWGGSDSSGASGGGCSTQIGEPSFEVGYSTCGAFRGAPDIAALADPYTGFPVSLGTFAAFGLASNCTSSTCPAGSYVIGGTSLASPLMAALVANIDAARVFNSKAKLGNNLNALLYQAASAYRYRFYDVALGNTNCTNGCGTATTGFPAASGWDKATGLGVALGPALTNYLVTLP